MAPHNFELIGKTLVILIFTLKANLKMGSMMAKDMHNLEWLRKQFLSDVLIQDL